MHAPHCEHKTTSRPLMQFHDALRPRVFLPHPSIGVTTKHVMLPNVVACHTARKHKHVLCHTTDGVAILCCVLRSHSARHHKPVLCSPSPQRMASSICLVFAAATRHGVKNFSCVLCRHPAWCQWCPPPPPRMTSPTCWQRSSLYSPNVSEFIPVHNLWPPYWFTGSYPLTEVLE